jgi:quercetin dioxygenase-like cupin family protein
MPDLQTPTRTSPIVGAEIRLPTADLKQDLPFFLETLGFRLDVIFPADDPAVAVISGHGVRIRLERGAGEPPGTLRLLCDDPAAFAGGRTELTAPNGTRVQIVDAHPPLVQPATKHAFAVRRLRDSDSWIIGRAGMRYRDLIPDRLGGSIIASHIRIPDGGPVPDMVHYHTVGFQLIFCYRGWVTVVYEDQGPPITLGAGDCVIQPPEIRHRVLEASDSVEVIEIGVPADHVTTIDHELELPTSTHRPYRDFQGTRFCHHQVAKAVWRPWRIPGFESRDTGIGAATRGIAGVHVARALPRGSFESRMTRHDTDILFTFVMDGSLSLRAEGHEPHALVAGDAFVIPPHLQVAYEDCSGDCQLLEVALPAEFKTRHPVYTPCPNTTG